LKSPRRRKEHKEEEKDKSRKQFWMEQLISLYYSMYLIRRFEETVLDAFGRGVFNGTTHTCLGQEADAAGVLAHLGPEDIVVSNHRCHGHFLAYGGDPRALFAELMGKATGVCAGRGGSQHLHWRNFYSSGVLGSTVPLAAGMGLAEKRMGHSAVAVTFLGDGALGEGVVYETLNMAAVWGAPVLFVVENNHIAQTTPTTLTLAGDIPARFEAFGIPALSLNSSDVLDISAAAGECLAQVRRRAAPCALVIATERLGPHSKGDDTRPADEMARLRAARDPLVIHAPRLDPQARAAIELEVNARVAAAFQQALADPQAEMEPL
jgi:TPP-dependent pyruvate/acetoin dehydrogenase alpha subunit